MREIQLTRGFVALVDDADYERINQHSWHVSFTRPNSEGLVYAKAKIGGKDVYMHRWLMETPRWQQCDHKDGDTLDNRRENLQNVHRDFNLRKRRHDYGHEARRQKRIKLDANDFDDIPF